jgi:Tol biopolymer transport system component
MNKTTVCLLAAMAASALPLAAQTQPPAPAGAAQTAPHAMTLDDLFRLQDVGDPQVSPDGKWVAYTVSTIDTTADKRLTDIWMVNWEGSEDIRLTYAGENSASAPRWSPDGKYVSFTSDRQGKAKGAQVWVLDRRGGEARQLTDVKGNLSFYAWSPDAKKLLLAIAEDKEAEAAEKNKDKEKEKPKPIVIDRYHFKQDVEGYISSETMPTLLYLFDVETHKLEKLTTDTKFDERNAAWSPDGSHIAYVSNHDADPDRTTNTDVFVVQAKANAAPKKLTTFNGPDGGRLAWSPDSKLIAYLHGSEPKYLEYNQNQLAVVPADGGEPRVLTAKLDRAVSAPVFADDGQSVTVLVTNDRSE